MGSEHRRLWHPALPVRIRAGKETLPPFPFSPRASALALYIDGATDTHADLLVAIGKHTTGKACVYVKSLAEIDEAALVKLVQASLADLNPGPS